MQKNHLCSKITKLAIAHLLQKLMKTTRQKLTFALDILITVLVLYAWACMIFRWGDNGTISAGGFRNLRYFTVLSNLLMAAASILNIICTIKSIRTGEKIPKSAATFRYVGATATALTFFVVITFLWPVYKVPGLYSGANFWFHAAVPVMAFVSVILAGGPKLTIRDSFKALIPLFLYGVYYIGNNLINGIGEGYETNDWYGFLYWGWTGGIIIFMVLILVTWGMALIMRLVHNKTNGGE